VERERSVASLLNKAVCYVSINNVDARYPGYTDLIRIAPTAVVVPIILNIILALLASTSPLMNLGSAFWVTTVYAPW
jgi:hypothetical protein